jgi:hypothetical protein
VTLFEYEKTLQCVCGREVTFQHREVFDILRHARNEESNRIGEIRRFADKIALLIVSTDYPKIDIEREKQKLRERIAELFPEKNHLYELIYESRFKRLEEQFRKGEAWHR